jgi:hypothetical protein
MGVTFMRTSLESWAGNTCPTYGFISTLSALSFLLLTETVQAAASGGFIIDTLSRETVRNFYHAVYYSSEGIPIGWTGNTVTCNAGNTSAANRKATLTRINFFRAMAGIPAATTFLATFDQKARQAALIMAANQTLTHFPPNTFKCYSEEGAEGAANSNLYLGSAGLGIAGPGSIDGFIKDEGDNNTAVGHRRWLLFPSTQNMGYGGIGEQDLTRFEASAVWVIDSHFSDSRPNVRNDFVSWPPPGYVPYPLIYPRWSFSYPNADFSQAKVSLSLNGNSIPVSAYETSRGAGENTLVWNVETPVTPLPSDQRYHVDIHTARIANTNQNFSYEVIVFDPAQAGTDSVRPIIKGNSTPVLQQPSTYTFNNVPGAEGYQLLRANLQTYQEMEGAENGIRNFSVNADQDQYSVIDAHLANEGKASFHLVHTEPNPQSLKWKYSFFVDHSSAALTFASRLGWATASQSAEVQVSLDEGKTWKSIFQQAGTGNSGESTFIPRTIPLKEFRGQTIQLRFVYNLQRGNPYFNQTGTDVGWHFDSIQLQNLSKIENKKIVSLGKKTEFVVKPATRGKLLFSVRATAFGGYPLDWGPNFVATSQ